MFRLMIVEDEPIVLEGMLKIINFEDLGFEVVSACSNGSEAIQKFDEAQPDVVITDICMDLMDGLEFIEKASEKNRRTKFVIVSGHQDFKFVKKALSLKVLDYILKPVTAKEFREILNRIAEELNEKIVSLKQFEEMQKSTTELQRNVFLNELINVKLSEQEIRLNLKKHDINLTKKYFQVLIFEMKDLHSYRKKLGYDSTNLLLNDILFKISKNSRAYDNVVSFITLQGYIVVIINDDKKNIIESISMNLAKEMHSDFSINNKDSINCYAGYYANNIIELSESFNSANKLLKNGVLRNEEGYYDANRILIKREEKVYDYKNDIEAWVKNVVYSRTLAFDDLGRILEHSKNAGYLLSDYKMIAASMVDRLSTEFTEMKIDFLNDVSLESFDEDQTTEYLHQLTEKGVNKINKESSSKDSYITNKALVYIHENYSDFSLDLQSVCKHLDISISYFSTVFKKNINMTFIKYINNYRIEKAKYFLEHSQKSISEISEMVGYIDPHYFGIVFKKHIDITPKKYRSDKRVANEEV